MLSKNSKKVYLIGNVAILNYLYKKNRLNSIKHNETELNKTNDRL